MDNVSALVKIMVWCYTGEKKLIEPMLTEIHGAVWRHWASMVYAFFTLIYFIVFQTVGFEITINTRIYIQVQCNRYQGIYAVVLLDLNTLRPNNRLAFGRLRCRSIFWTNIVVFWFNFRWKGQVNDNPAEGRISIGWNNGLSLKRRQVLVSEPIMV